VKKRRSTVIQLFVVLPIALVAIAYGWVLIRAHDELGGSQPNQQILGQTLNDGQRAMDQACTGVVVTKQSVWLVGRRETADDEVSLKGAVNLDSFLPGGSRPDTSEKEVSQISRLGGDGAFHTVAYINGYACPVASADRASLLLLTGAQLPESKDGQQTQTAVFRADGQGKNWQIAQAGFMAAADWLAWSLKPYFHGDREVWAAGQGKFFYSSDDGSHASAVESTSPLWEPPRDIPAPTAGDAGDIEAHIVQFSKERAAAWVSRSYWDSESKLRTFTRETQLTLHDGHWEAGEIRTTPGLYLDEVKDNGAGRVVAELRRDGRDGDELAELGADGHSWRKLGDLPNPFWPLPASSRIRPNQQTNFYVNGELILATIMSEHQTIQPSLRASSKPAKIEGNGVFFSTDSGSHWKQLAIPGYLGVLGFDSDKKQVYWNKGNWFENNDPAIYYTDLSQ
jgi:hypothetical protein